MNKLLLFKKITACTAFMGIMCTVIAQEGTHFLTGTFTEKAAAELHVNRKANGRYQVVASYIISPDDGKFSFVLPEDQASEYRIQINLMDTEGQRTKVKKISVLPLSVKPGQNYTLKITPSKIDTA